MEESMLKVGDREKKVLYLCDRMQCEHCTYTECKHTADINHAKNFVKINNDTYSEEKGNDKDELSDQIMEISDDIQKVINTLNEKIVSMAHIYLATKKLEEIQDTVSGFREDS